MKSRKMWALSKWPDLRWVECSEHTAVGRVPVLVTDASDMPDFEPGDRVRSVMAECVVTSYPFMSDGSWWVPVKTIPDAPGLSPMVRLASNLTKLPREKTTLLRVRTQEALTPDLLVKHLRSRTGVLDVRVEDPDE